MASEEQKQYEALVMDGQRRKLTTSNNTAVAQQSQDSSSCESLAKVKEAILVGLTSQYDLDLFREAQVKACEVEVSHKKPRV